MSARLLDPPARKAPEKPKANAYSSILKEMILEGPQKDYFFFIFVPLLGGMALLGWCYLLPVLHPQTDVQAPLPRMVQYPPAYQQTNMPQAGPGAVWGENGQTFVAPTNSDNQKYYAVSPAPGAYAYQPSSAWQASIAPSSVDLRRSSVNYQLLPDSRMRVVVGR